MDNSLLLHKLPKITIVTPSYNQGNYLEQTILSIIEQDYPDYELIIIDGGSTDNTVEVIKKYEKHIKYWVSEKDNGQADAINKGLQHASGDIFNWINSDDFLEHGALKVIGDYFLEHQDKNVLCGYTRCFFDEDNSTSHVYRMGVAATVHDTILNVAINQPATFYRMNIIKKLGGVNDTLRYVFDDELWFRYLCMYGLKDIGFTEKQLAQFRLHKTSKSVGEGFDKFQMEINELYLYMARELHFPKYILSQMENENCTSVYVSKTKWSFEHLKKNAFKAFFSAKYLNNIFLAGVKKNTWEALKLAIKHKYFKADRKHCSIAIKVAFS